MHVTIPFVTGLARTLQAICAVVNLGQLKFLRIAVALHRNLLLLVPNQPLGDAQDHSDCPPHVIPLEFRSLSTLGKLEYYFIYEAPSPIFQTQAGSCQFPTICLVSTRILYDKHHEPVSLDDYNNASAERKFVHSVRTLKLGVLWPLSTLHTCSVPKQSPRSLTVITYYELDADVSCNG